MNKLYSQLQRRLLPVLLLIYGAEPHVNHGLQLLHPDRRDWSVRVATGLVRGRRRRSLGRGATGRPAR
eukprot:1130937-Pleurochrysis_carterae.AAC.3